jgi:hypothetical protein
MSGAMSKRDKYKELRDDLNAVARRLARDQNGASAREIVAAFRKERPALIRAAADLLIDTALTRLVGDVMKRRADSEIDIAQQELFERAITDVVAVSNSTNGAGRRDRYRVVGTLPVALAEQMVKHHFETQRKKKDRFHLYRQLVEYVRTCGVADTLTLDQALAAANKKNASSRDASDGKGNP